MLQSGSPSKSIARTEISASVYRMVESVTKTDVKYQTKVRTHFYKFTFPKDCSELNTLLVTFLELNF